MRALLLVLLGVGCALLLPAFAAAADIAPIGVSADPTEDEPVTVTVSGSTEVPQTLFVFRKTSSSACSTNAGNEYYAGGAIELSGVSSGLDGDALPAGSFSRSYTFTPTQAGGHRVCAYLGLTSYASPAAMQTTLVSVRLPNAEISPITFSPHSPTEDEPVTVTVTGSTEVARTLFVFRKTSSSACSTNAGNEYYAGGAIELSGVSSGLDGDALPAGSFSRSYTFTPTQAGGHRVCAYVSENSYDAPLAAGTATVTVRLPDAMVSSITASPDPAKGKPVTIAVVGSSQRARTLFVFRKTSSSACSTNAGNEYYAGGAIELSGVSSGLDGDALPAGSFSRSYTFTPTLAGSYRICAYVSENSYDAPLAAGAATVAVRPPHVTLGISPAAPYLAGESATLIASGTAEEAVTVHAYTTSGDTACSYGNVGYGDPEVEVPAGAFSFPVSITYGTEAAHTVCAVAIEKGTSTQLAVGRVVVTKRPLALPQALPQVAATGRKPTFAWSTDPSGRDEFRLLDGKKQILRVTEAGAARGERAPGEDGEIGDVADYYDPDIDDAQPTTDPSLARIERRPDGTSAVRLTRALPPGRYTWSVTRSRDAGESLTMAPTAIQVNGPKLTRLRVSTIRRAGRTSRRPGHTVLLIRSTPFAKVTISLTRGGRTRTLPFGWGGKATGRQRIDWSCRAAGTGVYRYAVRATDHTGRALRRTGRFRAVGASRCSQMKAAEARARAARAAAQRERLAAIARAEAAAERARISRFLVNCKALGGTVVRLAVGYEWRYVCRSPYGGYIYVPT